MLAFFLILIVIYFYGLLVFMFVPEGAYKGRENACESALQCFLFSLKFGFPAGGGIHDILTQVSFEPAFQQTYWIRFLLDMSFFALVTILLINILFGIIIDTFAELRDQKKDLMEDMRTTCTPFRCSSKVSFAESTGTSSRRTLTGSNCTSNATTSSGATDTTSTTSEPRTQPISTASSPSSRRKSHR
jgi:hypothetical protein